MWPLLGAMPSSYSFNSTQLDCGMRRLIYEGALKAQPWRGNQRDTFDSLRLDVLCGDKPPTREVLPPPAFDVGSMGQLFVVHPSATLEGGNILNLDQSHRSASWAKSMEGEYRSVHEAVAAMRAWSSASVRKQTEYAPRAIVLKAGLHLLNSTLSLGEADSGTSIVNAPGEEAWLSGALLLPTQTKWQQDKQDGVFYTDIPAQKDIPAPSLATLYSAATHSRYTRARYPNCPEPERLQWGYATVGRFNHSLPSAAVQEWWKPEKGAVPSFEYDPLPSKDDSTQDGYNTWGVGKGGVCDTVWDSTEPSYWCGNVSSGGWAEVDTQCALAGQLQLPVGMSYYPNYHEHFNCSFGDEHASCETLPPRAKGGLTQGDLSGAVVHAWHSQSWAMHMFSVASHDPANHSLAFKQLGKSHGKNNGADTRLARGQQGGRNWCRCDQCTYAAKWCRQHASPPDSKDTRLIGGDWFVEGARALLDAPSEFHFEASPALDDSTFGRLYFMPNATVGDATAASIPALTFPVLHRLVEVRGTGASPVKNVSVKGVGFRDALPTFDLEWSAPSGGDWSLHRGGALMLEGVDGVSVEQCHFRRLDGNALFLSKYTRAVTITRNEFAWLGDGAMATWGDTQRFDATAGQQPRGTLVEGNYIHELGMWEKQSSAWGQAKACATTLRGNIMFNMPRAAINFNDGLGGGNLIEHNLIWNTCRESGDHGPINSWDRMPFLVDTHSIADPTKAETSIATTTAATAAVVAAPSFNPVPNSIRENLIVANYGGSQAVDNDDGSSFYHMSENVFYSAEGLKMDYGGHDSTFEDNLVIVTPYDGSNCINVGGFKDGHGDRFANNTCVLGTTQYSLPSGCGDPTCANASRHVPDMEQIGEVSQCTPSHTAMSGNRYYTPEGNASVQCGGQKMLLAEAQKKFKNDLGSTSEALPEANVVLAMAKRKMEGWF